MPCRIQFSLRWLLAAVAILAVLLAVASWHLMLALYSAVLFALPALVVSLSSRRWIKLTVCSAPFVLVGVLYGSSYMFAVGVASQPGKIAQTATMQSGRLVFFRYHTRGAESFAFSYSIDSHPLDIPWTEYIGFHSPDYFFSFPGLELARSGFLVHIMARYTVDQVDVLSISFLWLLIVQAMFLGAMLPFALRKPVVPGDGCDN